MSETQEKEYPHGSPPGVSVPWGRKEKEFGAILGDKNLVKREWEKLDLMAYMFIWSWVHR